MSYKTGEDRRERKSSSEKMQQIANAISTPPPPSFPHKWSVTEPPHHLRTLTKNPIFRCSAVSSDRIVSSQGNTITTTKTETQKRVFFLDVNPLCYNGSSPSLHSFARWISLLFSHVSLSHPLIAVLDGEGGHQHRKRILPSYKAHRMRFFRRASALREQFPAGGSHRIIAEFFKNCNVPVVKIDGQEADDVIATLSKQVLDKGKKVVIASPDKDFKQLISEDVQLVVPLPELDRWSFYTLKHYIAQYDCDPQSDLSLRCIIGDEVDGVPGLQSLAPEFGKKTALKLLRKHGTLENLLNAASVRTVGKQYAQEALTKYAFELRRNYQVLALRRDIDVHVQEEWLFERDATNDSLAIAKLQKLMRGY